MKRSLATLLVAALVMVVTGCAAPAAISVARANVPRASADPALANQAADAINAFGLELFLAANGAGSTSTEGGPTNAVVSPASIAIALAMARAGAVGQTAAEMDAVLHGIATAEHAGWLNALDAVLATRSGTFRDSAGADVPVALRIANAPFAQRDMTLVPAYLEALASRFGAGLRLVDYKADPEAARQTINAWVKDQTEARIPELIPAGVIDNLTRLTLVNAIYLKAPWETAFSADLTRPVAFTRADGTVVAVPTMSAQLDVRYAAGEGWRAVELPYVGGSMAMTIIVPDDLATFEAALTPDRFGAVISALADRTVALSMPKFSIDSKLSLRELLTALGMPSAFDPDRADFSGVTTEERLYITAVIHQANIDVDEKGTTAAAATAVVMGRTSMPSDVVTLKIDRPFLFVLRDVPTETVLFLGHVADPTALAS
jgi:serpin B